MKWWLFLVLAAVVIVLEFVCQKVEVSSNARLQMLAYAAALVLAIFLFVILMLTIPDVLV